MPYLPTIGLEIHIELKTRSKMFCSCKNNPEENRPNFNICPICTGHPGTLPIANKEAIKKVIKTGLALNCKIAEESKFDRKNYFYPDLPKGYQISQYDQPLCTGGYLEIDGKKINIKRIHLEEDTGSLIHSEGTDYSLVNFNRAGIPLMELVTEPVIHSAREARLFAQELQLILRYLEVSSADMEKGQMRVEVNISLSKGKDLGVKVEIKNLNSFKSVEKSIEYEIERQTEILERGGTIKQETRGWDEKREITFPQREKEKEHDYRYFPEPDLLPMYFDKKFIQEIKNSLPELPQARRKRFKQEYFLDEDSIEIFVVNKDLGEYFEKVISELHEWLKADGRDQKFEKVEERKLYKLTANYLISDVQGLLKGKEFIEKDFKITPENFAEFIKMIYREEISSKIAKMLLVDMFNTGADPSNLVDENDWRQIIDPNQLESLIKEVISKNEKAVNDYKKGKENALHFLAGQIMAITQGRANPDKVFEILKKLIS